MKKDDILAFLDKKFAAKAPSKSDKKKKDKKRPKSTASASKQKPEKVDSSLAESKPHASAATLLGALQAEQQEDARVGVPITTDTLYKPLVPAPQDGGENAGVKSLKQFHLKAPEAYRDVVQDKIFSIGQNSVQAK